LDSLVQVASGDAVEGRQVGVEHHLPAAQQVDGALDSFDGKQGLRFHGVEALR
jgi:hypothetical protein